MIKMQLVWAFFILVQHLIEKELYLKIQTCASVVRMLFSKTRPSEVVYGLR